MLHSSFFILLSSFFILLLFLFLLQVCTGDALGVDYGKERSSMYVCMCECDWFRILWMAWMGSKHQTPALVPSWLADGLAAWQVGGSVSK